PSVRMGQRMQQARLMCFPCANVPVEIVLIDVRTFRLNLCCGFGAVLHPLERHHPVRFPGLTIVTRECLLKSRRIRGDVKETVSRENRSAIEYFLIVEFAAPILEFAYHRLFQRTPTTGPIQTPLMRVRIVQSEAQAFDVTGRAAHLKLE